MKCMKEFRCLFMLMKTVKCLYYIRKITVAAFFFVAAFTGVSLLKSGKNPIKKLF